MFNLRLPILVVVLVCAQICNVGCAPGPYFSDDIQSNLDEFIGRSDDPFQQAEDVLTGKRNVEVGGNVLTGDLHVSTTSTTEEKVMYVGIIGCVILALIGCCVALENCCKPQKRPIRIVYQQMPPPLVTPRSMTVYNIKQVMNAQALPKVHSAADYPVPPPPYPETA